MQKIMQQADELRHAFYTTDKTPHLQPAPESPAPRNLSQARHAGHTCPTRQFPGSANHTRSTLPCNRMCSCLSGQCSLNAWC